MAFIYFTNWWFRLLNLGGKTCAGELDFSAHGADPIEEDVFVGEYYH